MTDWAVPLTSVRIPADATRAAAAVLERGWLSMGPEVEAFEEAFAEFTGCDHAVACSSGTASLQLAMAAAGVGEGDEVVMPSLTFVACANVARLAGARPVFADVAGPHDLTLDPERVAAAITPRTRALVVLHYGGRPASGALVDVARNAGIAVIEDVAHAPGAADDLLGPCGGWGLAGCFSFFANKNLPLGEGGMLTTNDPEVGRIARSLRSHGMTSTTWERRSTPGAAYDVEQPGWNLRLDEPRAAMGAAMLEVLEPWNARRAAAVARYRELLGDIDGLVIPNPAAGEAHHLMVVLLPENVDRDEIAHAMAERGVQTSVHYRPIHTFTAYAGEHMALDRTEAIWPRLLTLPLSPHLSGAQIELVAESLSEALARARSRAPRAALAHEPS